MAGKYDKRFSEESYATKEDVSLVFNVTSMDFIWEEVLAYRKNFTETLELPTVDKTKLNLVMTHSISNRLLAYERGLNKAFFQFNKLSEFGKNSFRRKRLLKIIGTLAASVGSKQTDSFLLTLIDGSVSALPNDAVILQNYLVALKFLQAHDAGLVTYSDFNAFYSILLNGSEPLAPIMDKNYRKTSPDEPHYYQTGYVYKAALAERIDDMMNSLCSFANDENLYVSVRALACLYYVYYVKPFDGFHEALSCLGFKMALMRSGQSLAPFINIEGLILFRDDCLKKADENVQKTFDLTYFFDKCLPYLANDLVEMGEDLEEAKKDEVQYEQKNVGFSASEKEILVREAEPEKLAEKAKEDIKPLLTPDDNAEEKESNQAPLNPAGGLSSQIYGPLNVAMPVFPKGFEDADIEQVTIDLLETYPTLRKSQAHFYASHCTVGRSYTIQEFKKCEQTSYETARTSMDYLSQLGFYEKAKVRNKFVYRPIPRR